jgi:uncharacterized protein YbaR (Trm112 family)/ubiquinone/menaquinone biosynthesis C-methylase UbiE
MDILCCPLCKGKLELQPCTKSNEDIMEGSMLCSKCKNHYSIRDGIPRMYVPDTEIIALSRLSEFSEFIITPENLNKWIEGSKIRKTSSFFTNRIPTKFLVVFGWILLIFAIFILSLFYINSNVVINSKFPLFIIYLLVCVSVTFFAIDYLRYRTRAKMEYLNSLHILKKLSDKHELSEYDVCTFTKDREEDFKNTFEKGRKFVSYKAKKIASILDNHKSRGKNALNIGCGGELHKSVSEPYFDKGYHMIGVDINEEYLKEFKKIFDTDVVQANSMALPFRNNNFDLINFTDIVEHLHHPFLGLSESQRVLKEDGAIILTTNNHSVFSVRCINPLVFIEKVISLYFDRILPPRNILGQWMDFKLYHTVITKKEISKLMKAAGFKILSLKTQFPNKDRLNEVLNKFPAFKFMCSEFMIIGKKEQS